MSFPHSRWTQFELRKPRNPLLRLMCAALGLIILAGLLVLGLFAGAAMLLFAMVVRLVRGPGAGRPTRPTGDPIIEGEYTVVHDRRPPLPH